MAVSYWRCLFVTIIENVVSTSEIWLNYEKIWRLESSNKKNKCSLNADALLALEHTFTNFKVNQW